MKGLVVYVTTGVDKFGLDRRLVARFGEQWYWLDIGLWRRTTKPSIDLDYTQRWFGYSQETMERARQELR